MASWQSTIGNLNSLISAFNKKPRFGKSVWDS